jgi:nitrous oxidase accessory protein NosD
MGRHLAVAVGIAMALALTGAVGVSAETRTVRCDRGADLQRAIDRAAPGDRLLIRGTCRGEFLVDKTLTLRGREGARIMGNLHQRLLTITEFPRGKTVTIVGLTLAGGAGCVNHAEANRVIVKRSRITGCIVGLELAGHVDLVIRDSILQHNDLAVFVNFMGNVALIDSIVRENGQGIVAEHARVVRSTIARNETGGLIGRFLTVRDSRIRGNRGGRGGGISVPSGGLTSDVTVEDTVIVRNSAILGGGMYREQRGGLVTTVLRNVIFRGNSADEDGGGLYIEDTNPTLVDVVFEDNRPNDCTGCPN